MSEELLTNENVRKQLKEYLKSRGVKNRWIVLNTGLSDTSVSRFVRGQRDLDKVYLEIIYKLIR